MAVVLGAGIAWALLSKDMPVSGNISGEDGVAAAVFTSASVTSGPCTFAVVNGTDRLTINGAKLASGTTHKCRANLTLRNEGNTEMRAQKFGVTSTVGTVSSGFPSNAVGCGAVIPVKNSDGSGGTGTVNVALDIAVPVGSSGTLSGNLNLVDTPSHSSTACSPSLS